MDVTMPAGGGGGSDSGSGSGGSSGGGSADGFDVDGIILLDIGGYLYRTTRATLLARGGGSFFSGLLSGRFASQRVGAEGALFIDRDGAYFAPLLEYLRTGELVIPPSMNARSLFREAAFYCIELPPNAADRRGVKLVPCKTLYTNGLYMRRASLAATHKYMADHVGRRRGSFWRGRGTDEAGELHSAEHHSGARSGGDSDGGGGGSAGGGGMVDWVIRFEAPSGGGVGGGGGGGNGNSEGVVQAVYLTDVLRAKFQDSLQQYATVNSFFRLTDRSDFTVLAGVIFDNALEISSSRPILDAGSLDFLPCQQPLVDAIYRLDERHERVNDLSTSVISLHFHRNLSATVMLSHKSRPGVGPDIELVEVAYVIEQVGDMTVVFFEPGSPRFDGTRFYALGDVLVEALAVKTTLVGGRLRRDIVQPDAPVPPAGSDTSNIVSTFNVYTT